MTTQLNRRIEALAKRKGLVFRPWEFPRPWEIEDGEVCPWPPSTGIGGAQWWPKCAQLRAALIAELEAEDETNADMAASDLADP